MIRHRHRWLSLRIQRSLHAQHRLSIVKTVRTLNLIMLPFACLRAQVLRLMVVMVVYRWRISLIAESPPLIAHHRLLMLVRARR